MPVFCLSFHAAYRCANSGACCTSGWAIPVEAPLRLQVAKALASGRLHLPAAARSPFVGDAEMPDAAAILRCDTTGACSCYDRDARRCRLHGQLGHDALPVACQHFPRVCLIDSDGTFVTLSHYCPTAARLLIQPDAGRASHVPADNRDRCPPPDATSIVEAPAAFAPFEVEGLDAREALPPLLRPRMLADRESYRRWERLVVDVLAGGVSPEAALEQVIDVTEGVRRWEPRSGPLVEAVDTAGALVASGGDRASPTLSPAALALDALVRGSVPAGLSVPPALVDCARLYEELVVPAWSRFVPPVLRYLAAKAFANWCAYQGRGLRTVACSLVAALSVLKVEAVRQCAAADRVLDEALLAEAFRAADLLLVHLASREELAARLSEIEEQTAEQMKRAL